MIKVQWIPTTNRKDNFLYTNIAYFPPEPAYKYFLETKKEAEYILCPAFSNYLKNTYIIKAPFDFKINIDKDKIVTTNNFDQKFFDDNIFIKEKKGNFRIHIQPRYFFITNSKNHVKITSLPPILQKNYVGFIPGEFYISKWIRQIDCAFEVYDFPTTIDIKRGDPMYMVKFTSDKEESITLEQGILTQDILNAESACISLKNFLKHRNFKTLYKMSENYINLMKNRIFK